MGIIGDYKMGTIRGIDNYSDSYKEYGKKNLEETAAELNKAGIKVFPQVYDKSDNNIDSCIINKSKNNKIEDKKTDDGNKSKDYQDNKKKRKVD